MSNGLAQAKTEIRSPYFQKRWMTTLQPDNPVRVVEAFVNSLDMQKFDSKRAEPNNTGRLLHMISGFVKVLLIRIPKSD